MRCFVKFLIAGFFVFACQACSNTKGENNTEAELQKSERKSDSIELRSLLIDIYKWHEKHDDMPYDFDRSGLDMVKLNKDLEEMKRTGFFSNEFLTNYQRIGDKIDFTAKHDTTVFMTGLAFPFQEYDSWHGGQGGIPDWNKLTMLNLSIADNKASFGWTTMDWDTVGVGFQKQNNKWKMASLELMDLKQY